jgi:hypothetical protein
MQSHWQHLDTGYESFTFDVWNGSTIDSPYFVLVICGQHFSKSSHVEATQHINAVACVVPSRSAPARMQHLVGHQHQPLASCIVLLDRTQVLDFVARHNKRRFITYNAPLVFRALRSLLLHNDAHYHTRPDASDNDSFHSLEPLDHMQESMWEVLCELVNQSRMRDLFLLDIVIGYGGCARVGDGMA